LSYAVGCHAEIGAGSATERPINEDDFDHYYDDDDDDKVLK